jgi:hypothetical protein
VWSVFRWKAAVPNASSKIDFVAGTSTTAGGLPATSSDPSNVSVGTATNVNSPAGGVINFQNLKDGSGNAISIESQFESHTPPETGEEYLRLFMTFTGGPVLYEWQVLYDCVPAE